MALPLFLSAAGAWIGVQTAGVWGIGALAAARWGAAIGGALGSYLHRPKGVEMPMDRLAGITFTTASKGHPLQILYGKTRIPGTIIWYGNFQVHEEEVEVSSGGKGFFDAPTQTLVTYTTSVAIALCEGVIQPTIRMWANEELVTLADIAYTVHQGYLDQAADAHMDANLTADQVSLRYPGIAYLVLEDWNLGMATTFPSMTFEVQRGLAEVMVANRFFPPELATYGEDANGDMNPACIIADFLTNQRYGMGLSPERLHIESFVDTAIWCEANGIFISPVLNAGTSGLDHLEHLLSYFDGFVTHSQGRVKLLVREDATAIVTLGRPVDFSAAPAAGYEDWNVEQHGANVVPSEVWRRPRLGQLIAEVSPWKVAREDRAGVDHFWFLDQRGVLMDYNEATEDVVLRRLLPVAVGAIVAAASSAAGGFAAANAFDGVPATSWRPVNWTVQQWVSGAFGITDTDSVQVDWNRLAPIAPGAAQPYRRGLRLDPADHDDPLQTTNAICTALIAVLVAHDINQVSVFVSLGAGFYFNTGTVDYIPYGSDDGDFLATFIPLATAAGIATYASFLPYLNNTEFCQANSAWMELESGAPYDDTWMCPNKPGVAVFWRNIFHALLGNPAYGGLTGVDLAEARWGWVQGNQTCWCDPCQAAFAAAYPGSEFGESDLSQIEATDTPAVTDWEQWRADVLSAQVRATNLQIATAGLASALVTVLGVNETLGNLLALPWGLKTAGIDIDGLLDGANAPDIVINQITWQEKAGYSKDYITFGPEWTEYATRQWGAWINGRAVSVIHIGAYRTYDWFYGYDHELTAVELQRAYEAAMRGGALHFESYSLATIIDQGLWAGLDEAYGVGAADGPVYNSILCEIQMWDGAAWRPIGRRAWFRTRASDIAGMPPVEDPFLGHFDRLNTDRFRLVLYPAPWSDEQVEIPEIEFRSHTIHQDGIEMLGGLDFDSHAAGWSDLVLVRWTPAQAFMHRIDENTGLDVGGPWPFDTLDIQNVNDLAIRQVGAEPRFVVCSQGYEDEPATLCRYSTAAPGTLVGAVEYPAFDGTTGYIGVTHMMEPGSVTQQYMVFSVAQAGRVIRLHWRRWNTLADFAGYADLEYTWFWPSSLAWAGGYQDDLLACEFGRRYYVYRRNSLLTDGGTPAALAEAVLWAAATVDCDVQIEEALAIPTTSVNTITSLKAVVWDWADGNVGGPTIDVYGLSAEDPAVETYLGQLVYTGFGELRLAELDIALPYPDMQRVRFRFTRAPGSAFIGVAEVMATRTLVGEAQVLGPADYVEGGAPVLSRQGTRDTQNSVRVEYRLRGADYNVSVAERRNDLSVQTSGERATQLALYGMTTESVADKLAAKMLRHMATPSVGVSVILGPQHGLLECGDLIELSDADYGIDSLRLRILRIQETKDGQYEVTGTQEF